MHESGERDRAARAATFRNVNATTRALNPELFPAELPPERPERTNRSNTGKGFESEIAATAEAYRVRGMATLRKVDPPVRVLWIPDKKTGERRQRVIFQRNPWPDFSGCWTANGARSLFVECKSTATHRLGLREGQLGPDQVAALVAWRAAGAAVCLLWQWAGAVALFTPEMILASQSAGAKSLVFADGLHVPRGEGGVIWAFLSVLEGATR